MLPFELPEEDWEREERRKPPSPRSSAKSNNPKQERPSPLGFWDAFFLTYGIFFGIPMIIFYLLAIIGSFLR